MLVNEWELVNSWAIELDTDTGGTQCPPMGPGWFIFFQNPCIAEKVGRKPLTEFYDDTQSRIKRDDEEILWLIQLATSYKLL